MPKLGPFLLQHQHCNSVTFYLKKKKNVANVTVNSLVSIS